MLICSLICSRFDVLHHLHFAVRVPIIACDMPSEIAFSQQRRCSRTRPLLANS